MLLKQAVSFAFFALFVGVYAAAPEFIWQGFWEFIHNQHLSDNSASIVLISLIFGLAVEPTLERLKNWWLGIDHQHDAPIGLVAVLSLALAVLTVLIHESISRQVGAAAAAIQYKILLEWAFIPFGVTICYFLARQGAGRAVLAIILASSWAFALGYFVFDWDFRFQVTTFIPSFFIIVVTCTIMIPNSRSPESGLFSPAAKWITVIAAVWLVFTATMLLFFRDISTNYLYEDFTEWGVDFRFYLGWTIGLCFAPSPLSKRIQTRLQ